METPVSQSKTDSKLEMIREGYRVFDSEGKEIGKVKEVYFPKASDPAHVRGQVPPTANDPNRPLTPIVSDFMDTPNPENMPETIRNRLMEHGFIRIDGGLLSSDSYALPDQIADVSKDRVSLNVQAEKLIKRDW